MKNNQIQICIEICQIIVRKFAQISVIYFKQISEQYLTPSLLIKKLGMIQNIEEATPQGKHQRSHSASNLEQIKSQNNDSPMMMAFEQSYSPVAGADESSFGRLAMKKNDDCMNLTQESPTVNFKTLRVDEHKRNLARCRIQRRSKLLSYNQSAFSRDKFQTTHSDVSDINIQQNCEELPDLSAENTPQNLHENDRNFELKQSKMNHKTQRFNQQNSRQSSQTRQRIRASLGLHLRKPSSQVYRLQNEVVENAPLDEGIYSDSNDSMVFDNNNDTYQAGQQKLLHHVKVLDDHLENLKSKLSQLKVDAEEQQYLDGFVENKVMLSDRDNKQNNGNQTTSSWKDQPITASKFITENKGTESVYAFHQRFPSQDSMAQCKIPAEFISIFATQLNDIERMKKATESILKFSVICQREMDTIRQDNQKLQINLETAKCYENQHNAVASNFEDHLGSMEGQIDQLKKQNELQKLDIQRYRLQLYQERQIWENIKNEHGQTMRSQMNELQNKLMLLEQDKDQLQYQLKTQTLQFQNQNMELKSMNKKLEEELYNANHNIRNLSKQLQDRVEEIQWLEDQVEIKKQEQTDFRSKLDTQYQELLQKFKASESKVKKQKKLQQKLKREHEDLKKKYKVSRKRQRDTLNLFGIDSASIMDNLEQDDPRVNSPKVIARNKSISASFISNDKQNNTLQTRTLCDVIDEEFSHEEATDPNKQEKVKSEKEEGSPSLDPPLDMRKSISQCIPKIQRATETLQVNGIGSFVESGCYQSSKSHSQHCTPRINRKSFDYTQDKMSFEEIRQIMLKIYKQGSELDTPISSKIYPANDLNLLFGENDVDYQLLQKQREVDMSKRNLKLNNIYNDNILNDKQSLDNSSHLYNQSNLRSIEKRISAYKNQTMVSQSMNKTFMESNIDILDVLDDVSKMSQSQIFGQITNIPQLSARKMSQNVMWEQSGLDENTLKQIIQLSASVREKREFVEYKNLLIEEQNHLRVQTLADDGADKEDLEISPTANKEIMHTAVKKSNSPYTQHENKLQVNKNHSRNMTITQGKIEAEQTPSSPIKKFQFDDNKAVKQSTQQKSNLQHRASGLLIDTNFNLNKTLQTVMKKSGSSSDDNDGYEKVQVVEFDKNVKTSDREEEDEEDDSEMTSEDPNDLSQSPQQLERIKSLSQSITEQTRQVLNKINSELNSAQEKNSVVIYQSQCNGSDSAQSDEAENYMNNMASKTTRSRNRSFHSLKRGLMIQTSQLKLKAIEEQSQPSQNIYKSANDLEMKVPQMPAVLNTCGTPKFQQTARSINQSMQAEIALQQQQHTQQHMTSHEQMQVGTQKHQMGANVAPLARARHHYNNWMNNQTINSAGMVSTPLAPSATAPSTNPSYKTYVSPVLAASKRKMLAHRTSMGCHQSNNASLQNSPMMHQSRVLHHLKTDRVPENFSQMKVRGQMVPAGGVSVRDSVTRKARPVTGQGFVQKPLVSSGVRQSLQSESQFGVCESEMGSEKYQVFINMLHKKKDKWERYRNVLTNDTCFNVNHLKEKYNIKEDATDQEEEAGLNQEGQNQFTNTMPSMAGFNPQQLSSMKGKGGVRSSTSKIMSQLQIPKAGSNVKQMQANDNKMTRTNTGFASQSSHGLMEVFCGRKQTTSSNNKSPLCGPEGVPEKNRHSQKQDSRKVLIRRNSSRMSSGLSNNASHINYLRWASQNGMMMKSNSQMQLRMSKQPRAVNHQPQQQQQYTQLEYQTGQTGDSFGHTAHLKQKYTVRELQMPLRGGHPPPDFISFNEMQSRNTVNGRASLAPRFESFNKTTQALISSGKRLREPPASQPTKK